MSGKVRYIKIARKDGNGVDITNTLESLTEVVLPLSTGNRTYTILNRTRQNEFFVYYVTHNGDTDIPVADRDKINEYIFTGSMTNNEVGTSFPGGLNPPEILTVPISSSIIDNLDWFNSTEGVYYTNTYPQKSISINLSGTLKHFAGALNPSGVGIYLVNPTDTNYFTMIGSYKLAEDTFNTTGTSSINLSATVASTDLIPGSYLTVMLRSTNGLAGTRNIEFESGAELKVGSAINATSSKEIIVEPYLTQPFFNSDCDVLQGEVEGERPNPFLQDVDYSTSTIVPVNVEALASGSATRATVPESYYTALSQINNRYNGSKNQTQQLNTWTNPPGQTSFGKPWNIGTYGKTSPIDINQSLVAYCDWIGGTSPELNDKVAAHIKYLIDEEGNAISPNLDNITVTNVQHNFEEGRDIDVSLIDPSAGSGMQVLNGLQKILKGGYRVEPILYSQIPTAPFSSSITMETSSALPVANVTFKSNLNNAETITAASSPETIIFDNEIYDYEDNYTPLTGKYIVDTATIDSGVDIELFCNYLLVQPNPTGGRIQIRVKNLTTGATLGHSVNVMAQGVVSAENYILGTLSEQGFGLVGGKLSNSELVVGHEYIVEVEVDVDTQLIGGSSFYLNQIPSTTENSFLNITSSFWGFSASRQDVLTGSQDALNQNYGLLKQEAITDSGFNEPQYIFTIKPGDQFRFQDDESRVYNVVNTIPPESNPEGKIIVYLDNEIPAAIDKDYFLIRRYVEDGSFIIFDEKKPAGDSGAAFIKPKYVTKALEKDIDQFILDLKSKNLLT
jgi:hypothetical protein